MRHAVMAILALTLAPAGCGSPTGTEGLIVVTSLSSDSFRPGFAAEIQVTVTNHGVFPQTILSNGCGITEVTTARGDAVGRIDADCDGSIVMTRLRQGEQVVFTRAWPGDIRTGEFPDPGTLLPPGVYALRSRVGTGNGYSVESRPIRVTLTP